jgi:hemoglobin
MSDESLYERLGGYDAIAAVVDDLLPRLQGDSRLGRFWQDPADDGGARERQLFIDFLCASAGGPVHYGGRDMRLSHEGMGIDEDDWSRLIEHLNATLDKLALPEREKGEVLAFIESTKADIVETA